jgi:hypothetical protein
MIQSKLFLWNFLIKSGFDVKNLLLEILRIAEEIAGDVTR